MGSALLVISELRTDSLSPGPAQVQIFFRFGTIHFGTQVNYYSPHEQFRPDFGWLSLVGLRTFYFILQLFQTHHFKMVSGHPGIRLRSIFEVGFPTSSASSFWLLPHCTALCQTGSHSGSLSTETALSQALPAEILQAK